MSAQIDIRDESVNPLDSVEEILNAHNWVFNRMNNDELIVSVKGKACNYRLFFIWQEDMNAMQFCCQYEMNLDNANTGLAAEALMHMNENLWMGHFDIPQDTKIPSFRHTCLLRGVNGPSNIEHIEDLVDISLAQCERYYSVFYLLSQNAQNDNILNDANMNLALMDAAGES